MVSYLFKIFCIYILSQFDEYNVFVLVCDKNNKDCDTKLGKKSLGNKIPTKIDFEKSGLGKTNNPDIIPIKIDIYAFFSLIDLVKKL